MNFDTLVSKTVDDVLYGMQSDHTANKLIKGAISSIINSNHISKSTKKKFNDFSSQIKGGSPGIKGIDISKMNEAIPRDILIISLFSRLNRLNGYDFKLINYAADFGMDVQKIIVLLLIRDIITFNDFCLRNSISGVPYYNFLQLKRSSEQHYVTHAFS